MTILQRTKAWLFPAAGVAAPGSLGHGVRPPKPRVVFPTLTALVLAGMGCLTFSMSPARAADAPATAPTAARSPLDDLTWMSGCWGGTVDGVEMIECWTTPKGGMLLGMHKDIFPSGKSFFEFLRVSASGDTVIYWGSPKGIPPTPFKLVEHGAKRAVFANPTHDFPQRILYWMDEPEILHARGEGPSNGRDRNEEWAWHRLSDIAPRAEEVEASKP